MMAVVFETDNFLIVAPDERPHISRTDGGHLVVIPKQEVEDRTKLSAPLATELMKMTMLAGAALRAALAPSGIEVGRINYQDNGNWTPHLHVHIYGRAKGATVQKYGTPVTSPATKAGFLAEPPLEPLQPKDIEAIKQEIARLLQTDQYKAFPV